MSLLVDGTLTVPTSGTAVPITTTDTVVAWIAIAAHETNEGVVMIGGPTVVAAVDETARGMIVPQVDTIGASELKTNRRALRIPGPINLKGLWVDARVDGEGLYYMYMQYRDTV